MQPHMKTGGTYTAKEVNETAIGTTFHVKRATVRVWIRCRGEGWLPSDVFVYDVKGKVTGAVHVGGCIGLCACGFERRESGYECVWSGEARHTA